MKKILLVENDAFLINVYTQQFRKSGYSTTIATNSEVAVIKIKNVNPDLLILDTDTSKGDTFSSLRKIKEDAGIKELKMLVLSGFNEVERLDDPSAPFATTYISKAETTAEEIVKEIEKLLN